MPLSGFVQRDLANYLLANSYYEQKRYIEAGRAYQEMRDRLSGQLANSPEKYPGQRKYLDLANAAATGCAVQEARQQAKSQGKGQASR